MFLFFQAGLESVITCQGCQHGTVTSQLKIQTSSAGADWKLTNWSLLPTGHSWAKLSLNFYLQDDDTMSPNVSLTILKINLRLLQLSKHTFFKAVGWSLCFLFYHYEFCVQYVFYLYIFCCMSIESLSVEAKDEDETNFPMCIVSYPNSNAHKKAPHVLWNSWNILFSPF